MKIHQTVKSLILGNRWTERRGPPTRAIPCNSRNTWKLYRRRTAYYKIMSTAKLRIPQIEAAC